MDATLRPTHYAIEGVCFILIFTITFHTYIDKKDIKRIATFNHEIALQFHQCISPLFD